MRTGIKCLVVATLLASFFATLLTTPISFLAVTFLLEEAFDGPFYEGIAGATGAIIGIFLPYGIFIFCTMKAVDFLTFGELKRAFSIACIPMVVSVAFISQIAFLFYCLT